MTPCASELAFQKLSDLGWKPYLVHERFRDDYHQESYGGSAPDPSCFAAIKSIATGSSPVGKSASRQIGKVNMKEDGPEN
jgi:hypothetical protein